MKKKVVFFSFFSSLFSPLVLVLFIAIFAGGAIGAILGQEDETSCVDTGSTITVNVDSKSTEENAKAMFAHWKEKYNATPQAGSGILGTLQMESQLDPAAVNASSGATGIAQWLGNRKTNLEALASEKGKEVTNLGLQLEYLDQELASSYYASSKEIFQLTDVHEAAKEWLMKFEGMSQNPEQWFLDQRYAYADHWYSVIGSGDLVSNGILDNAVSNEANAVTCGTTSTIADGEVLDVAMSLIGYFTYSQPKRTQFGTVEYIDKYGYADCSSFVWLVLAKAGYSVPANVGWFTGSMTADARGSHEWLEEVAETSAKAGDIIIVNQGAGVGNNGHTAVLAEDWHGETTKVIEQGGMQKNGVGEGQINLSFGSLLSGGDICYARPVKKVESKK